MSSFAIIIVLGAAVLHAVWNALVKASTDRLAILGLIAAGHVALGMGLAAGAPLPSLKSWGYIAASTIIHFGYNFLLYHSYRLGDLSHVYPIARGMAPILVTLGALVFANKHLSPLAWLGVLLTSGGIFLLSGSIFKAKTPPIVVLTAMATGLIIASYSLVDGLGVRLAGTERGYIGWLFIAEVFVALAVFVKLGSKVRLISRKTIRTGLLGGIVSALVYALVIYARSFSSLAAVSTLRETSVVFAALIGMIWLGERPWKLRLVASGIVASGVVLMTLASTLT